MIKLYKFIVYKSICIKLLYSRLNRVNLIELGTIKIVCKVDTNNTKNIFSTIGLLILSRTILNGLIIRSVKFFIRK